MSTEYVNVLEKILFLEGQLSDQHIGYARQESNYNPKGEFNDIRILKHYLDRLETYFAFRVIKKKGDLIK